MERTALRLIISQNQANYRREETVDNKMTYPLPPYSSVIGAIHNACGFREYNPMDLSIQGNFHSLQKEAYTDHAFLNNLHNDRGYLVKTANPQMLSKGYELVAKAKKGQGNDFDKEITIDVINRDLLTEYQNLGRARRAIADKTETPDYDFQSVPMLFIGKDTLEFTDGDILNQVKIVREIKAKQTRITEEIKDSKTSLKKLDKSSPEYESLNSEIKELTKTQKQLKESYTRENNLIEEPYEKFKTLTTSLKFYEVLYDLNLVIHIAAPEGTLNTIADNICNLTGIGRYEDFIEVQECKFVKLGDEIEKEITSSVTGYISAKAVDNETIVLGSSEAKGNIEANGTKYYLNKNYVIENKQRIFNKVPVIYTGSYSVDPEDILDNDDNVYVDEDGYIVSLV